MGLRVLLTGREVVVMVEVGSGMLSGVVMGRKVVESLLWSVGDRRK